jgi:hypothetical protein
MGPFVASLACTWIPSMPRGAAASLRVDACTGLCEECRSLSLNTFMSLRSPLQHPTLLQHFAVKYLT